jgi:hypothetical protein
MEEDDCSGWEDKIPPVLVPDLVVVVIVVVIMNDGVIIDDEEEDDGAASTPFSEGSLSMYRLLPNRSPS